MKKALIDLIKTIALFVIVKTGFKILNPSDLMHLISHPNETGGGFTYILVLLVSVFFLLVYIGCFTKLIELVFTFLTDILDIISDIMHNKIKKNDKYIEQLLEESGFKDYKQLFLSNVIYKGEPLYKDDIIWVTGIIDDTFQCSTLMPFWLENIKVLVTDKTNTLDIDLIKNNTTISRDNSNGLDLITISICVPEEKKFDVSNLLFEIVDMGTKETTSRPKRYTKPSEINNDDIS